MGDTMENGPSNLNGEAERVWERAWTLDEMRKSSANWSLAADSGLFLYLQDFSQWMVSKTHEIEKQLDGLIRDTKATDSCLHTVFNDFLMLSNIQFIENRVYDEEVEEPALKTETLEKHPEQEKTREQKEAELIPKIQEAVNYGLRVLESAFEQLDVKIGNSDSEDEEATDKVEPILEPKDLYVDRPLPYLIGSQAFMEQDDVGLGDLSSDEMSIDSDRDIESEDDEQSHDDFDQEDDDRGSFKKKSSVVSYDDEEEEEDEENDDSDLFGQSDKEDDDSRKDDVGPTSFADELAARIKGDITNKPDADRTSLASGQSANKKKTKGKKLTKSQVKDNDEMFPSGLEENEDSPFGGMDGGLFSGGKGLFDNDFDEDDDEGDLFSEAPKKVMKDKDQTSETSVSAKNMKIPTGAVSIFPDNSRLGLQKNAASPDMNGSAVKPKVQATPQALGGGLFDDNDDDDFFSGKTNKLTAASQVKTKPKKTTDLFGGDEEEDDGIFSAGSAFSQQSKKIGEEETAQPPEKKLPAGAVSIFGPGTKNLLGESLKKHQPSTHEKSDKSEEITVPPNVKKSSASKTADKSQSRSIFSDYEDSQIFPGIPKSQSKPEGSKAVNKAIKAKPSIFDDDEEDLFSSVLTSSLVKEKTAAPPPQPNVSSALFSDDEDQWISSQPSTVKPQVGGGIKSSTSAPSRLSSAKVPPQSSLFDDANGDGDYDDDDLFAATKESRQKKPPRASLLFEDENDDDKGSLFGFKPPTTKGDPKVEVSAAAGGGGGAAAASTSTDTDTDIFVQNKKQVSSSVEKVTEKRPLEKKKVEVTPFPEDEKSSKKPAGAVTLFGGVDLLGDGAGVLTQKNQSPLKDEEDLEWHKEMPPPLESKEKKNKKNTVSLFDEDDDDDDDDDKEKRGFEDFSPLSTSTKPLEQNTFKSQEQKTSVKSTGVFQDEELLFTQTKQRDNDPEVDLFATVAKPSVPPSSSVKSAGLALFGDEEDDDDLFSTAKTKAPPKVPVKPSKPKSDGTGKVSEAAKPAKREKPELTVKPKESASRIGKLQAALVIDPGRLMPGAGPQIPGAVGVIPGLGNSLSAKATGSTPTAAEGGVSFDTPVQVTTLQNANKDRVRGAVRRRPQTRAARQSSAQLSEGAHGSNYEEASQGGFATATPSLVSTYNSVPARPSELTLPTTVSKAKEPAPAPFDEVVRPKVLLASPEDLFAPDDFFVSASKHPPTSQSTKKPPKTVNIEASKNKESIPCIFSDESDDLFATVKSKPVKNTNALPFSNDAQNDDCDLFGTEKTKDPKTLSSSVKQHIQQDEKETQSKVAKKPMEQPLEGSLFDDNIDIFADLTPTTKTKDKKAKKKVETKSIFDDDMDDIFSSGITKPAAATSSKKTKKPVQEGSSAEESGHSIFDDPLNVFGGK